MPPPSPSPPSLPALISRLLPQLPPGALSTLLSTFPHSPPPPSQISLGVAIYHHLQTHPPTPPTSLLFSQILHVLPSFHTHTLLPPLLHILLPPHTPTQISTLHLLQITLPHHPPHLLPHLFPSLHSLIFQPCSPTYSSDSSTPPRLQRSKQIALALLQDIVDKFPDTIPSFWTLFLPVGTVSRTSCNLAALILFDHDFDTRSKAITICIHVLMVAKRFAKHVPQRLAFISLATNALQIFQAMYSVLASALLQESHGVLLAKLARLTTIVFEAIPPSLIDVKKMEQVMNVLLRRIRDVNTDQTSRGGCLKALAMGIKAGNGDVKDCLNVTGPFVEVLGVWRECARRENGVDWIKVKQACFRDNMVQLHALRVVQMELGRGNTQWDVVEVVDVLEHIVEEGGERGRRAAIGCLGSVLENEQGFGEKVLRILKQVVREGGEDVKWASIALGKAAIKEDAEEALQILQNVICTGGDEVKGKAMTSYVTIVERFGVHGELNNVLCVAKQVLERGGGGENAVQRGERERMCIAAVNLVGIGIKEDCGGTEVLEKVLRKGEENVRCACCRVWADVMRERGVDLLTDCVREGGKVGEAAKRALEMVGTENGTS